MPAHINNTRIDLISKKLAPLVPADYRPISSRSVIYKLIAKCLANRLKPHLLDYIHQSQQSSPRPVNAFLFPRNYLDIVRF
jgi:hypothetical protein